MPIDVSHIDLSTVNFHDLNRDQPNDVDDLDDYDNFWTTLDDLSDLVTALTQYGNE
jgi:hypothetical protein